MISVRIQTYGEELVATELEAIAMRAENLRPLWGEVGRRLEGIMRDQFATEGARGGERWAPLSEKWMWQKFREGASLETLRASEAMYDALTSRTEDSIRLETDTTFEFGADLDQFRIQQDYNESNNFPERRPINITPRDVTEFVGLMEAWVLGTVNRRGQRVDPVTRRFTGGRV